MRITHRTAATFCRYCLLSIAASVAIQLIKVWADMAVIVGAVGVVGLVYALVFAVRYYGLFKGARWANDIDLHTLDIGLIEFVSFAAWLGSGALITWLLIW